MSQPRDGWDGDERDALDGLESELAEIRRKHQNDPSLALLRAADADALPPELQAKVTRHLQTSAWSRAVVEGLRDTGVEDRLDAVSAERLLQRIQREAQATAPSARSWKPAMWAGGLALAATLFIAVVLPRSEPDATLSPTEAPATPVAVVPAAPAPVPRITFTAPEIKLSPSALTWRGTTDNPFLRDLAPAFDAYRAGDYPRAAAAFDRLVTAYPEAIEVRFYQGVSHLLSDDSTRAIEALDAAARLRSPSFADDVAWALAVARQHAGQQDAAPFTALCKGKSTNAAAACAAATQLGATSSLPSRP